MAENEEMNRPNQNEPEAVELPPQEENTVVEETAEATKDGILSKFLAPREPKAPKEPRPKKSREPKAPKESKEPKKPKEPKSPKVPKEPKKPNPPKKSGTKDKKEVSVISPDEMTLVSDVLTDAMPVSEPQFEAEIMPEIEVPAPAEPKKGKKEKVKKEKIKKEKKAKGGKAKDTAEDGDAAGEQEKPPAKGKAKKATAKDKKAVVKGKDAGKKDVKTGDPDDDEPGGESGDKKGGNKKKDAKKKNASEKGAEKVKKEAAKKDKKDLTKKENAVADEKTTNLPADQAVAALHKGHPLRLCLLISLGWLCVFAVFLLFVRFDPTEGEAIRGSVLLFLNPDEESREEYYAGEILSNMDWEKENDLKTVELDEREAALDERESALDEREDELTDREDRANEILEQFNGSEGEGPVGDQTELVAKALTNMQVAKAAESLANMDLDKAIQVCVKISAKKLGGILSVMDPDLRDELLDALVILREDLSDLYT